MKKLFSRLSASILAITFLFTQYPALAQEVGKTLNSTDVSKVKSFEPEILGEVIEKREEFVKHFKMSDGSMKAIVYSDQIHFKDGNEFKEIDNTLISNPEKYLNTKSPFKVKFSKQFKNNKLITLNSNGSKLSFSYVKKNRKIIKKMEVEVEPSITQADETSEGSFESDEPFIDDTMLEIETVEKIKIIKEVAQVSDLKPEPVVVENFATKLKKFDNKKDELLDVSKNYSKAKYKNADPEVDFDYSLSGCSLKEYIILNEKLDFFENDSFEFEFKTDLKIEKDKTGNLNFENQSGNIIFVMPKGSMWDSNESFSSDVDYKFSEIDGGYIISVIPNFDWINDSDRLFPIFIDPSIKEPITTGIQSNEVGTPFENTNISNLGNLGIGHHECQSGYWKSFIKCTAFPIFSHGEIITNSKIYLKTHPAPGGYDTTPNNQIAVRKVLGSWEELDDPENNKVGITWNNKPKTQEFIADYILTDINSMDQWHAWDITKMTKEWYTMDDPNENDGVETSSILPPEQFAGVRFISSHSQLVDKPYFEISYRNFIGEEPYWSYTSHSAGLKGSGKVNNYAGTLSLSENILSYLGSRNPLSITNAYNNSNYNSHANSKVHLQNFPNGYSHSSSTGLGFTLDFNKLLYKLTPQDLQHLDTPNPQDYKYLFIDSDGTWHYFKDTVIEHKNDQGDVISTEIKIMDEDGLHFEISEKNLANNELFIKDKGGNKLTFNKPFVSDICFALKSSEDFDGNTTTYHYGYQPDTSNSKISRITDASERETLVSYENGKVSEITEADGKKVKFTYSGEKLIETEYQDGLKNGYTYDEHGRLERVWTNFGTGASVKYAYASNSFKSTNFFKVRSVTEFGSQDSNSKTMGNSQYFNYEMNRTKVTYKTSNLDVAYHKNTEIWQFDHDGRVTGVMDENGNMISQKYVNEKEYPRNIYSFKVKHVNDAGRYTNNLLKNSSANKFENDKISNWEIKNWNPNDTSSVPGITRSSDTSNLGEYSFKSENTMDSSWWVAEQKISIAPSKVDRIYTLSGDIKINGALTNGSGASLHLAAFKGETQQSGDKHSEWILDTDNQWRRTSVTINVPAGSDSIKCYFGLKESVGTAYFDCLQLEVGEFASDYNMVENSSFDNGFENWGKYNLSNSDVIENGKLKIVGNPTLSKACYQDIPVNKNDAVLAVSAGSEGLAVPHTEDSPNYHIGFKLLFEDGYQCFAKSIPFNPSVKDVQRAYGSITANDYHPGVKLASIRVEVDFNRNCNTVYFDDIQVCIDDHGVTYGRDSNADITRSTDNIGQNTDIERTSHHEAQTVTLPNGDVTTNVYDDENGPNASIKTPEELHPHKLLSSSSPIIENRQVKTELNYDGYGNVLTSKFGAESGSKKLNSEATYSASGNYVLNSKDSRGKTTIFDYNQNNGNLNSVTNPKNVNVSYNYDSVGRMLGSTCLDSRSDYNYSSGTLSSISHAIETGANVTYNFVRDMFGKITQNKVGNQVLTTNTYDAGNGLLKQTKFNNNQIARFDYDKLGRLVKKQHLKGKEKSEFEYFYDNKNRLVKLFDSENNLETKFEYDLYGRLAHTSRSDGVSSDIKYNNLTYGLIDKAVSKIFGIKQTIENTFGAANILEKSKIITGENGVWSKYSYDDLGRVQSTEVLNLEETSGIKHEIAYLDVNSTDTTNLVNSIEAKKQDGTSLGKKFSYEYDDIGNITNIKDINGDLIAHYEYDGLNQLIRENNASIGKTLVYTYDFGGNIQSKTIYNFTENEDLPAKTPENTVVYEYNDSNWKDKLSSYNGQKIIYDGIGNPTEYINGWKFEWTRGRKLGKALNSCYNIEYKYDDGGIRTGKTVNGITTDFVTNGLQVLVQKTGDETIVWQMDGNGSVAGFNHNGTQYFYIKNAQGDVIGINDTDGNLKVEYTYDSWGKLVSITDPSQDNFDVTNDENHIGFKNPLRYRSYYYDNETQLYYLNARYYDPEIGRFINADDNLIGGLNLFVYCANNPVNAIDVNGEDAILLIDKNSVNLGVGSAGHMGIAIEKDGKWYHFYYGCGNNAVLSLVGHGGTRAELWEFDFGSSTKDHSGINSISIAKEKMEFVNGELQNVKEKLYEGTYTDSRYLSGDFSASYDHIVNNVKNGKTAYNATTYNCKHASLEALSKGTFTNNDEQYKKLINESKSKIAPNMAFGHFTTSHDGGFK